MTIRLPKEQRIRILNSEDLYTVMRGVLMREQKIDRNREHFWIVGLATDNTLLYVELISLGTVNRTLVDPMEVYSLALQKRSVKIVLVHNHPSGQLRPSEDDKDLTDYLIQVGVFVNVRVIEHLIITEEGYFSFVNSGLLEKLELSRKHVLPYQERARLTEDIKVNRELGQAEGREAERLAVARAMKAKGIEVGVIAEVTGLSLAKVKGLVPTRAPKPKGGGSKVKAEGPGGKGSRSKAK